MLLSRLRSVRLRYDQATISFPLLQAPVLEQFAQEGYSHLLQKHRLFRANQPNLPSINRLKCCLFGIPIDTITTFLGRHESLQELVVWTSHDELPNDEQDCQFIDYLAMPATVGKGPTLPLLSDLWLEVESEQWGMEGPEFANAIRRLLCNRPRIQLHLKFIATCDYAGVLLLSSLREDYADQVTIFQSNDFDEDWPSEFWV